MALGAALALKTMFPDSEPADRAEIAGKLAEAKRRRDETESGDGRPFFCSEEKETFLRAHEKKCIRWTRPDRGRR